MNRLTEALKRTRSGAIELPASSTSRPEEVFPTEGPPPLGAAERPTVAERADTQERDEALLRIRQPEGGQRVREQDRREPARTKSADRSPLALFAGYDKALMERLVVPDGAPPIMTEEYRRLAAALHHAQIAHGTKVLMVASASPGEGKTLTAVNLALTLSQSYERHVLLIDADLRKPTIHNLFNVENASGLLDALREDPANQNRKVSLVQVSSRLKLLLSGGITPDPMSLLTSESIRSLLKDASEAFDWVILDTPPSAFLPDGNLLASAVDAALLVVRAFVTPYPLVQRVVEAVGHDKIIGVVLNHAEHAPSSGYYGYGYYGYGAGYSGYGGYYGLGPSR